MKINRFFTEVLGANLRNQRWSWGAVDPLSNRIFLRVWRDQIIHNLDGELIMLSRAEPRTRSAGFAERHAHIDLIRNGAAAFGVLCTAADENTQEARAIKSFDESKLLELGELTEIKGETFARIVRRVPVDQLARSRSGQTTLSEDLRSLVRKKVDSTTKEALIAARIGQGTFRSQVLAQWENQCSVTGSQTLDAIRASHIKPWRDCSDSERLDPNNGLPLVAHLDALFDAGLITFERSGTLIVSSLLSAKEISIFGIEKRTLRRVLSEQTVGYLEYHKENVFQR